MLITIIIDQNAVSIFLTQVKLFFSSNTLSIIFTSITLSHGNTLQPKASKFQTLPASPTFPLVTSSQLKTTSDHMSSTEPTKLITSPTFLPSSSETLHLSQLKFQPQSSLPFPLLCPVTSPCTPTFPSCPTLTAHPSFSAPPSTSRHHLVPQPPSKVLLATSDCSLYVAQHITEEIQTSRGMWVNTSQFTGKDNNEIVSCRYFFVTFFIQLWICTCFFVFPQGSFDLLYGYYSLQFELPGKVLPVTLTLLFLSFIL